MSYLLEYVWPKTGLENWKPVHNFKVHHKREIMTKQFEELTDFQWEVIEDFFPEQARCKHELC